MRVCMHVLSGTVPRCTNFSRITSFDLYDNFLTGTVPVTVTTMTTLYQVGRNAIVSFMLFSSHRLVAPVAAAGELPDRDLSVGAVQHDAAGRSVPRGQPADWNHPRG